MYIEPILPDFQYVKIRRTGGILGVDQSLHVDGSLAATVSDRMSGTRRFALDAMGSAQLMHALSQLVARDPQPSTRRGCDLFHYDIELSYGGTIYRFNSVDLGADEALHGVTLAANQLIDHQPKPFQTMQLHVEAGA
jgi:hypothetical protein